MKLRFVDLYIANQRHERGERQRPSYRYPITLAERSDNQRHFLVCCLPRRVDPGAASDVGTVQFRRCQRTILRVERCLSSACSSNEQGSHVKYSSLVRRESRCPNVVLVMMTFHRRRTNNSDHKYYYQIIFGLP